MGNEHNKQVDDPVVDGDKCQGRVRERGPGVRAGFVFKRSGQGRSRRCTGRFAGDKGLGHASAGKSMAGVGGGLGTAGAKAPILRVRKLKPRQLGYLTQSLLE